jgi:hypothetical protein
VRDRDADRKRANMSADPRRGEAKTSTLSAILAGVRSLFGGGFARGAWCREQRRHLRLPGHSVVWVRGEAVPWAEWGARQGYFEVQRMDGLPYLRALGAPSA